MPQRQESFDYLHADAATLEALAAGAGEADFDDEPEQNEASPSSSSASSTPSGRSAATTRAGAAPARSSSGAMAHSVEGTEPRSLDDLRAAVEEIESPAALGS